MKIHFKNLIIIAISLLLIISSNEVFATDFTSLTLDEAIELGIKNSTQLKINDLDLEVKKLELSEALYKEKKYDRSGFSLGTIEGFMLDEKLYSTQAEYALKEETIKSNYIKENLKYNITSAYYKTLEAKTNLDIVKSTLDNLNFNNTLVKKQESLGTSSKSELYLSNIALNEGYINLENANKTYTRALRSLNMILNIPLDSKYELTSTFTEKKFDTNLNEDIESSFETRLDMIQISNNYNLAKLDFDITKGSFTPNTYKYKYKERTLLKIESLLNDSKQNVTFDIKNKYDDILSNKNNLELAKSNVLKAEEVLRLKKLSYEFDSTTNIDVREAIVQLNKSNLALSNAISNYNLSILNYNKVISIGNIN